MVAPAARYRRFVTAALLCALAPGWLGAQQADSTKPAATPQKPQTAPAKPSAAEDNPFPEEQSKAAQEQATEQERADRQAADSGPSADAAPGAGATSSSSRDKLAGMDVLGDHDSRIANGAGGTVVDPKLSTEDLKVGQQYMGMGNYQGAYQRFKEACTVNPANLDAVFFLAEAARKTAHLDEAAENYQVYLQAQPSGARAKAARKALAQLEGK